MGIRDLTAGERVEGFFALRKVERREFQGGEFLALEIGDSSGRIDAVMWDGFAGLAEQLAVGQVVKVRGVAGTYRDRPQIRIDKIRPVQDGEVDPSEFVARSPVNPEQLSGELDRRLAELVNPHLGALLKELLGAEPLRSQYLAAPAGKLWHHDVIGGLAEHSFNVARICEFACTLYPDLDRDLLIAGALLHDLGKIEQYTVGAMIDYSDEGRLVGHINSGDFRITTAIRALPGFPGELERVLRHLIVSHQGLLENGSPVVPQTPEAFVLYCADELDSKMGALRHVAAKTGERDWSDFVRLIERHIYFGHRRARAESDEE